MSLHQDIAIPKTIGDICDARELAREKVEMAHRLFEEASKALTEVATSYTFPMEGKPRLDIKGTMREVDERLWRHAFDKTGLMQYMDRKARMDFDNSLSNHKAPEFTFENVRTTLLSTAQDAEMMFKRGLVEFFLSLPKYYKTNTNEPFKVSKRAVMHYATSCWMGKIEVNHSSYGGMTKFNDLDRVFKTLDDKLHQPRELEFKLNAAWAEGEPYEDEYYQIKGFKNGNAHILFKRDDLLEKANRLIHEYYDGQALAGRPTEEYY